MVRGSSAESGGAPLITPCYAERSEASTAMHTRPVVVSLANHSPTDPSPTQDNKGGRV